MAEPIGGKRATPFTVLLGVFVLLVGLIFSFRVLGLASYLDGKHAIRLLFLKEPRALFFVLGSAGFAWLWWSGGRRVAQPETFVSRSTRFLLTLVASLFVAALGYLAIFIFLVLLLEVELLPRMG